MTKAIIRAIFIPSIGDERPTLSRRLYGGPFNRLLGGKAVATDFEVRSLEKPDVDRCREILNSLPDWFGIEASNQTYIEGLSELPAAVATVDGRIVGFIALTEHTPSSWEIYVLGVDPSLHRHGAGKALIAWAEAQCHNRNAKWLHVKTRGPLTPDPQYEKTRQFYLGCGFDTLFETLELWGPENSALIMVKFLQPGGTAA
ncbi:MAG: GNAT family N-acetyltransferase [Pseudomonadales bacterium]|nr:GNAT family N-acetyltransferase [Pseudomonadales bacterium]